MKRLLILIVVAFGPGIACFMAAKWYIASQGNERSTDADTDRASAVSVETPASPPNIQSSDAAPTSQKTSIDDLTDAYKMIHGVDTAKACEKGMQLLATLADGSSNVRTTARKSLAWEYIDGNDCVSKSYVRGYWLLATIGGSEANEGDDGLALRSLMTLEERKWADKIDSAPKSFSNESNFPVAARGFALRFVEAESLISVVRDSIAKKGDTSVGSPVWLVTNSQDTLLFQTALCSILSEHSDKEHCKRIYAALIPRSNALEAKFLNQSLGPFFDVHDISTEAGNLQFNVGWTPSLELNSRVAFSWNGTNLDLTDSQGVPQQQSSPAPASTVEQSIAPNTPSREDLTQHFNRESPPPVAGFDINRYPHTVYVECRPGMTFVPAFSRIVDGVGSGTMIKLNCNQAISSAENDGGWTECLLPNGYIRFVSSLFLTDKQPQ